MGQSNDDRTAAIRDAVGRVIDPELRRSLGDLGMIDRVELADGIVTIGILLTIAGCPAAKRIESDVASAALSVSDLDVQVDVGVMTDLQRTQLVERLRAGRPRTTSPFTAASLTRVIAVTSGKGGVGKSTVTANLAVAMAQRGLRVGLIDADVHGFSIPGLLGLVSPDGEAIRPTRVDELVLPPVAHGVKVVSIGMFLPEGAADRAVAWRGPLLHRTVEQFLTDVYFGDLDMLLVDMPPGTGDIAIAVGQLLPHAEMLVVTTPQTAAADVSVRSGLLARQLGQRVAGVIETMSPVHSPDGSTFEPFGAGGGAAVAAKLSSSGEKVRVLAHIPFSTALRSAGDAGLPISLDQRGNPTALAFAALAEILTVRPRGGLAGRSLPLNVART